MELFYKLGRNGNENGTFILGQTEDNCIKLMQITESSNDLQWQLQSQSLFSDGIYDFEVLPGQLGKSFLYGISRKDFPLQIRDATDDTCKCSLKVFDEKEAIFSPTVIAFDYKGTVVAGGGQGGIIRCFDIEYASSAASTCIQNEKFSGLVSALEICNDDHGNCLIAGSYRNNLLGIFDWRSPDQLTHLLMNPVEGSGIFQVKKISSHHLLAASRKDDWIHCWDIRSNAIISSFYRKAPSTFQKIYFECFYYQQGLYLLTGDFDGVLKQHNLLTGEIHQELPLDNLPITSVSCKFEATTLTYNFYCATGTRQTFQDENPKRGHLFSVSNCNNLE